jgi:hypothetical protein
MNTATVDNMMRRLGIDVGCRVPRYGLLYCCALRNCGSCAARAERSEWLAKEDDAAFGPLKFCANPICCRSFFAIRPSVVRTADPRAAATLAPKWMFSCCRLAC